MSEELNDNKHEYYNVVNKINRDDLVPIEITLEGISKSYGSLKALNNVNLQIKGGNIIGLLGPNGSGKTTLLRILAGLTKQSRGKVKLDNYNPGQLSNDFVAYLPDYVMLPKDKSTKEIVDIYADFYNDFDKEKANAMLDDLGIAKGTLIKNLSKGAIDKVQLIVTMARRARLYILDEPISGVDPAVRDYIIGTILQGYSPGSTIIIATHLISDIEGVLKEIIFLKNGEVLQYEKKENLLNDEVTSINQLFKEVFKC